MDKIFSLTYRFQNTYVWKQLEAPFRKIWGPNISLMIRIRIEKFFFVDPNSKKMSSDPQHWPNDHTPSLHPHPFPTYFVKATYQFNCLKLKFG
jgi:hypothetical protein